MRTLRASGRASVFRDNIRPVVAVALENGARTGEGVAMPAFCSPRNDETSGTLARRLRPDAVAATSESELTGYHVTPWSLGGERESGRKSNIFPGGLTR